MENFNELLQKYADFIVRVGVNPQPGQTLIINCPLDGAPLARLCVRSAFEAGARDVQMNWTDDAVTRTRMELCSEEALTDHKGWQLRRYLDYAESEGGVCVLHLIADDPELFAGLDGAKISRVNSSNRAFMQPWREYTMNDRVQWSIAALPAEPWAKKMFPELDTAAAIEAQWKLIFDTCRVTGGEWMSRSSVVWGPFSIVWGLAIAMVTQLLYRYKDKPASWLFVMGTLLGGAYEYLCSVFTEVVFGAVFWDYSAIPFNLGGRINLLYCFFWGFAAIAWFKVLYPPISHMIESLPKRFGTVLTWGLCVFMAANIAVSSAALVRYNERVRGEAAATSLAACLDEHFDDARMAKVYPKAVHVEK